jgi:hypothetical protein
MSESITNFGTPRSIYSLANGDIEIFGNVIANQFIGDGQNLTNISIEQINASTINYNKKLLRELGGTNNNNYIDKGIIFNNDTTQKFETSPNLYWDYDNNILYVNNQNIITTFSNYVENYSNATSKEIIDTSNSIIKEIKSHILSNISFENIKDLPKGSEQQYGILKVGEGIFVDNGVISIVPKPITITKPTVEPELPPYIFPDTIYEKFVFKYDSKSKTTFNDEDILQYFFNFDKLTNTSNIKSIRKQLNNIIINSQTDVLLKQIVDQKYEYTPLENNYLYFSGTSSSYASFDDDFDIYNIYSTNSSVGGTEIGFTFSFWFKIYDLITNEKFLFSFSNSNSNTYRFEIKLISETDSNYLVVNIRQLSDYQYIIRNVSIDPHEWYHFAWTINANNTWTIYINNQKNIVIDEFIEQIVPNINVGIFSDSKYIAKTIGNALFRTNVNLEFSITDLRIYNKALTKSEIFELYTANEYTLYKLKFNDPNYTTCDMLLIGGGGGGTNEGGGGAGELIYIDNLTADQTENDDYYEIKVGRGGAGRIIKELNGIPVIVQNNSAGINTVFDKLIVRGGGSYSISGGSGGSGSGNGGTSNLNTSADDYSFRKIYFRGNNGFELNGGGGGSGSSGYIYNGGNGLGEIIDDINDTSFNFKNIFDLLNDDRIGYYNPNSNLTYFAAGGASNIDNAVGGLGGGGYGSDSYVENIRYEGIANTGSGGGGFMNHGYGGGSGIVLLRYLKTQILSTDIGSKIISSSNNLLSIINNLTTDDIIQKDNSINKFIINNVYNDNLLLNGSLTINSNLIVHGDTTVLNTDIYISEKINISNYDNDTALYIRQFGDIIPNNTDILRIDYNENTLVSILNTGRIGIGVISPQSENILDVHGNINIVSYLGEDFKFTINGRDIITETSNLLRIYYDSKFAETIEYIEDSCNLILDRLNNLTADDIADGAINRFIINNRYDNNLELKGDIIASNLVIYGQKNIIYTDVYYSEQIEIDNKSYGNAINIIQSNTSHRIFNASNSTSEVFTILGDGSVGIGGVVPSGDNLLEVRGNINIVSYLDEDFKFTINGRDIIGDTSNYVKSVYNSLISYYDSELIDAVIDLSSTISLSEDFTSNFVRSESNILFTDYVARDTLLSTDLTSVISLSAGFTSNFVRTTSNILFNDYVTIDSFASNFVKTASNILFTDYVARDTLLSTDLTSVISLSSDFTSNYVRSASNQLFTDYATRDSFTSNFVISTSNRLNLLLTDYIAKDSLSSNYVNATSNLLFTDYVARDTLLSSDLTAAISLSSGFTSNYVKITSNLLFTNYIIRDNFTSNFVRSSSNLLFTDYVARDILLSSDLTAAISLSSGFTSNYVKTASNLLFTDYITRDTLLSANLTSAISLSSGFTSNFVRSSSNLLFTDYITRDTLLSTNLTSAISLSSGFTSNYVKTASNLLFTDYITRDTLLSTNLTSAISLSSGFTSNYVKSLSILLFTDYVARDTQLSSDLTSAVSLSSGYASNYVKTASNILFTDYVTRDTQLSSDLTSAISLSSGYASNYVKTASNLLFADYITRDYFASNYVKTVSNLLSNDLTSAFSLSSGFTSNYVKTASNLLLTDYIARDTQLSSYLTSAIYVSSDFTSNYVRTTSNLLFTKITDANKYILDTSNLISQQISNLNADNITNGIINKFIVNNTYEDDLEIIGTLTASNLIIYGEKTLIYTDIHATKQLNIENQGTVSALNVKQINPSYSIFNASNSYSEVFTILNNGSVGIGGIIPSTDNLLEVRGNINIVSYLTDDYKFSINGRDIIADTSNYVLATSNTIANNYNAKISDSIQYIIEYILNTCNLIVGDYNSKFFNFKNYILETSNYLNTDYDIKFSYISNYILDFSGSNLYNADFDNRFETTSNYILAISNYLNTDYDIKFSYISNYILDFSGSNLYNTDFDNRFETTSNYVLAISNYLNTDYDIKFSYISNYILDFSGSNLYNVDFDNRFETTSNYILAISNYLNTDYDIKFSYISNYILDFSGSNLYNVDFDNRFETTSNYVLAISNYLNTDYDIKFSYISNYILDFSGSNIYNVDFDNRFESTSNYILAISNYLNTDYDNKFANTEDYILATSNLIRSDYDSKLFDIASYIAGISNYLNYQYFKMFTHRMIIQTAHKTYTKTVIKEDYTNGWVAIDNNESDGFVINIKPSHATSSILLSMTCHIGIDYETESRWWGIQLYRKIGDGNWVSLENANGLDVEIVDGSPCWISHNMGADNSLTSHSIINISGSFEDNPDTTSDVYYTAYWKSNLNNTYGRLYLNRPAYIDGVNNSLNYPITSSSWTASEILNTNTPFLPETPTIIVTQDNVGIGTEPSLNNKLNVYGNINIVSNTNDDYKFTINGRDIIKDTSNYTLDTSNIITDRINNLTADDIQNGLINKYIVSGVYNGNIELKGDFIASNITINGEKTKLYDNIFSTEVLDISNNGKYSTLNISQLDTSYDIFNAYNNSGNVFTILGNGNVGIGTKNPSSILEVIGDVNINSNLYVNSTDTIINSKLKTKNIVIENDTQENALTIQQLAGGDKILAISNINVEVFTIKNNGKIGINNSSPENTLDVYGNINASSFTRNGFPLSLEFSQGMIIQTKHLTYSKTEIRNGNDWAPINNDISNGFVISIKPSDITSKILISTVCHIGMEYETDSRWWGLRLYRKIGNGEWTHLSNANGLIENNDNGTSCWISHNLGADSSTYSHFITNVTGSYQDIPETTEMVYYTAYWKNRIGELSSGLLYLNKSSYMLDNNYPCPSSSWTATEIWNKGTSYIAPLQSTQIQINTQYNTVGIDTSPPTEIYKLNVNGGINIIDGTYNINGIDIVQNTSNFIIGTSNILMQKINELLNRIELLENM